MHKVRSTQQGFLMQRVTFNEASCEHTGVLMISQGGSLPPGAPSEWHGQLNMIQSTVYVRSRNVNRVNNRVILLQLCAK